MKPIRNIMLLLVSLLALATALPATALGSGRDVIRDCSRDGDLDRDYSREDLEEAERDLPSDLDEYTDCREVIREAQNGGRGNGGGSGSGSGGGAGGSGGGGSFGSGSAGGFSDGELTADERREVESLVTGGRNRGESGEEEVPSIDLGEESVTPSGAGIFGADESGGLPLPLLLLMLAVAVIGSAGGYLALGRRFPRVAAWRPNVIGRARTLPFLRR